MMTHELTSLDRILLLVTGILAAYQVAVGIDGFSTLPIIAYTIAFGVLLVAGLLLIILGFEVLDSPIVVIVSTIIPLSLATGLVWQHLASFGPLPGLRHRRVSWRLSLTRSFPMPGQTPNDRPGTCPWHRRHDDLPAPHPPLRFKDRPNRSFRSSASVAR